MKSITKKQFRILLTVYIAALFADAVAVAVADSWLLPQPLLDYRQAQSTVQPKVAELVISFLGVPGVVAWIVSIVGLYRFWPSARGLSVLSWTYMLVWMAFSPAPVISSALDGALSHCSTLLAGAVLAIIYFSPAAEWFLKKDTTHAA